MGIGLCIFAFVIAFIAARRSAVAGLAAVLPVGYAYGILRANVPQAASHFIFDAAVAGLYLARLFERQDAETRVRARPMLPWLVLLAAWPLVLTFVPMQPFLVQLVGLRAAVFLLPFLLFGARLTRAEMHRLAVYVAVLNLICFGFTVLEYTMGVERFFPHNANTELVFRSADVGPADQFRIPSTFSGSHVYAGTMVMTMPLLLGAWVLPAISRGRRLLLFCSMFATILGVFAAASRVHTVALAVVMMAAMLSGRLRLQTRAVILVMIAIVAAIVIGQQRLQRITTLQDSTAVSERVGGSVNAGFFQLILEYPFGNGLGGGGTGLPYFLNNTVRNPVVMENEYAHILLEQTVIGLCLWLTFIAWFFCLRFARGAARWELGEQLSWTACMVYFGTGLIGIGLLSSIPQTVLILLCAGWLTAFKGPEEAVAEQAELEYAAI